MLVVIIPYLFKSIVSFEVNPFIFHTFPVFPYNKNTSIFPAIVIGVNSLLIIIRGPMRKYHFVCILFNVAAFSKVR